MHRRSLLLLMLGLCLPAWPQVLLEGLCCTGDQCLLPAAQDSCSEAAEWDEGEPGSLSDHTFVEMFQDRLALCFFFFESKWSQSTPAAVSLGNEHSCPQPL